MPEDKKKDSKGKGGAAAAAQPELGPDGKPLPPVPLTETQQVQLQIENAASDVNFSKICCIAALISIYFYLLNFYFLF